MRARCDWTSLRRHGRNEETGGFRKQLGYCERGTKQRVPGNLDKRWSDDENETDKQ